MTQTFLIDTHVLLWATSAPEHLSTRQVEVLEDASTNILVSSVSIAEIEVKRTIGKIEMPHSGDDLRRSLDAEWLPLEATHAMTLRALPLLHRDPFDRLLIAQALSESVGFITSDAAIAEYQTIGLVPVS